MSYELVSRGIASELFSKFNKDVAAVLLTGSAARGETSEKNRKFFSDLDFLIVLKESRPLLSILKEREMRDMIADLARNFEKEGIGMSFGFANSYRNYWYMASPFMLELRKNALVLEGNPEVLNWPVIKSSDQISSWEGARLLANRLCEFFGVFNADDFLTSDKTRYALIKLVVACSECMLIMNRSYRPTYSERQVAHQKVCSFFSPGENELIETAYQAKLASDLDSIYMGEETIKTALKMVTHVFKRLGLKGRQEWINYFEPEFHTFYSTVSDLFYFVANLAKGRFIHHRYFVIDVYMWALTLAEGLVSGDLMLSSPIVQERANSLFHDYKKAPQHVSLVSGFSAEGIHW